MAHAGKCAMCTWLVPRTHRHGSYEGSRLPIARPFGLRAEKYAQVPTCWPSLWFYARARAVVACVRHVCAKSVTTVPATLWPRIAQRYAFFFFISRCDVWHLNIVLCQITMHFRPIDWEFKLATILPSGHVHLLPPKRVPAVAKTRGKKQKCKNHGIDMQGDTSRCKEFKMTGSCKDGPGFMADNCAVRM